jgi:hypothetical protein
MDGRLHGWIDACVCVCVCVCVSTCERVVYVYASSACVVRVCCLRFFVSVPVCVSCLRRWVASTRVYVVCSTYARVCVLSPCVCTIYGFSTCACYLHFMSGTAWCLLCGVYVGVTHVCTPAGVLLRVLCV